MNFSIVIPLYNKAPFIAQTLASVRAQSLRDFEVLVIDDGSTDGSDQIVADLMKAPGLERLRLLRQRNSGVSAARNRGIDEARGEWVVFLDADDWLHPSYLAALQKAALQFPSAAVVATDHLLIPHSEGPWPPHWKPGPDPAPVEIIRDLPARWMQGPTLSASSVAVKRSLLLRMQPCFPVGESVGEDLDLWFRLAEKSPIALVRVPLVAYRVALQGSLSAQHTPATVPPYLLRLQARARSGQLLPAQRRSSLQLVAQQQVTHARHALASGQRGLALRWLLRSLGGVGTRRWWLTLVMVALMPGAWVSRWQHWRVRKASPAVTLTDSAPEPIAPARRLSTNGSDGTPCRVSVVLKVLNEEKRLAQTLEHALRAVKAVGGEVVVADSCSSDRTVEIARAYPVRIVQLAHAHERSCGIGAQLGFQYARGEFIYILDGDMHMREDFLPQALSFLRGHPQVAGVGGRIVEQNLDSLEFRSRKEKQEEEQPGPADRLDCGGLYRRSAIVSAGYFADRNLHSYEEFDLAARLRCEGWDLWRMPIAAVSHFGHDTPPYALLMRRWRSGYICGLGELLRASLKAPRLPLVLREVRELRLYAATLGLMALLLVLLLWPAAPWPRLGWAAALLLLPLLLMSWRKRSVERAVYALVSWGFNALGLVRGLLRRQVPATRAVQGRLLQEGDIFAAPPEAEGLHERPALELQASDKARPLDVCVASVASLATPSTLNSKGLHAH